MITRDTVVQSVIDLFDYPSCLEIVASKNETLKKIKAKRKTAVDPCFRFDFNNYSELDSDISFYQGTSDDFFSDARVRREAYDVIYLDGLHTFDQTLRDLLNAIALVKPSGVIVIEDVIPNSYRALLPNESDCVQLRLLSGEHDKSWMGDVYRLVFFIHSYLQQFSFATVAENHGQTIIWRSPRKSGSFRPISVKDISTLGYEHTFLSRDIFNITPCEDIRQRVRLNVFDWSEESESGG